MSEGCCLLTLSLQAFQFTIGVLHKSRNHIARHGYVALVVESVLTTKLARTRVRLILVVSKIGLDVTFLQISLKVRPQLTVSSDVSHKVFHENF
jgi:hypothetical protein